MIVYPARPIDAGQEERTVREVLSKEKWLRLNSVDYEFKPVLVCVPEYWFLIFEVFNKFVGSLTNSNPLNTLFKVLERLFV